MRGEIGSAYIHLVTKLLGKFLEDHAFKLSSHGQSGMGEWYVCFKNDEFTVEVSKDRGDFYSIDLGTKIRPRPRAHMRSWSLSHLRGFLEGIKDHYPFRGIEGQASWLIKNADTVMVTKLINSEELRKWAVKASRRMFGQIPR